MGKSLQRENRSIRETGGTSGKEKKKRYLNSCRYDYTTAALLMRSFRYGTGEVTWKYSCSSTCDRKSDKKELHVLSEERTSVHNRNGER